MRSLEGFLIILAAHPAKGFSGQWQGITGTQPRPRWGWSLRLFASQGNKAAASLGPAPDDHEEWGVWWDAGFSRYAQVVEAAESADASVELSAEHVAGWVEEQRRARAEGSLSEDRVELLALYGFEWDLEAEQRERKQWPRMFAALRDYRVEFGDCLVPPDFEVSAEAEAEAGGVEKGGGGKDEKMLKLGVWVAAQRRAHSRGALDYDRLRALEYLDFDW